MKNNENIKEYFNDRYYNKDKNYNIIVSEIIKDEKIYDIRKESSFNFFKIVATWIITLLGTTGIVFASVIVYNDYIKRQDELNSNNLYINEEGTYSNDFTKDMIYDETTDLYYKVITNINDYNEYKNKLNDLPEMTKEDFNTDFLIIIGNWGARYPHENDLTISNIDVTEETTDIIMKTKENPDYNKSEMTLYAIIDKTKLKENIKLDIEISKVQSKNFINIESLPSNYSIENALKDGCFVEENTKVLSENAKVLDELIDNSKNNIESFVRIYSKSYDNVRIIDLQYKNGIFISNIRNLKEKDVYTFSFKYLTKKAHSQNGTFEYGYNMAERSEDSGFLLEISYQ